MCNFCYYVAEIQIFRYLGSVFKNTSWNAICGLHLLSLILCYMTYPMLPKLWLSKAEEQQRFFFVLHMRMCGAESRQPIHTLGIRTLWWKSCWEEGEYMDGEEGMNAAMPFCLLLCCGSDQNVNWSKDWIWKNTLHFGKI